MRQILVLILLLTLGNAYACPNNVSPLDLQVRLTKFIQWQSQLMNESISKENKQLLYKKISSAEDSILDTSNMISSILISQFDTQLAQSYINFVVVYKNSASEDIVLDYSELVNKSGPFRELLMKQTYSIKIQLEEVYKTSMQINNENTEDFSYIFK